MANPILNLFRKLRRKINVIRGKDVNLEVKASVPMVHVGSEYGGYWINKGILKKESIVYSIGVGEDLSFDLDLVNQIGCSIYAFDPTPKSINWVMKQNLPDEIVFAPWGVSDFDGSAEFLIPVNPNHVSHSRIKHKGVKSESVEVEFKKLKTIMNHFGHDSINLLKMDIEGEEYKVIKDIVKNNIKINQICIEFHHRFSGLGVKYTTDAVADLESMGLYLFHQAGDCCSFTTR